MGLLDVLEGMKNGPRGARAPSGSSEGGGGMSPWMIALLGVLAYKALQGRGGGQQPGRAGTAVPGPSGGGLGDLLSGGRAGTATPSGGAGGGLGDLLGGLLGGRSGAQAGGRPGGNLADMLPGGLGGLLGGAAAGSVLSGGLGNLINDLQSSGQGRKAQSWVGTGPNEDIAPDDLEQALGSDTIDSLSRQTGLDRHELLAGLSQQLPELVDQLTPQGRLPTEEEAERMF
jgi:uncharacterized protein YidB (DUF937 family)